MADLVRRDDLRSVEPGMRLFRDDLRNGKLGRALFDSEPAEPGVVLSFRYARSAYGNVVRQEWARIRVLLDGVEVAVAGQGRSRPVYVAVPGFPCRVTVESDLFRRKVLGSVALVSPGRHLVEVVPVHRSGAPIAGDVAGIVHVASNVVQG